MAGQWRTIGIPGYIWFEGKIEKNRGFNWGGRGRLIQKEREGLNNSKDIWRSHKESYYYLPTKITYMTSICVYEYVHVCVYVCACIHTHIHTLFKWKFHIWRNFPKAKPNKKPNIMHEKHPSELGIRVVQETPNAWLLPLPLVASQRLKLSLYCWTYHIIWTQDLCLGSEHRSKLVLTLEPPPWGLAFIVPENATQAFKRGK